MSKKSKILRFVDNVYVFIVIAVISMLVFSSFIQVPMRYIFKSPVAWADEITRYLFVWLSFFGAALAIKENKHVAVEGIVNMFPSITRKLLIVIRNILTLIVISVILYYGITLLPPLANQKSAGMQIPMVVPYSAIAVSFLYMWIYTAYNLYKTVISLIKKEASI